MHTETSKWHKRYIQLAKEVSTWSKDPSRKIGAVIVGEHCQIISQGFNGFRVESLTFHTDMKIDPRSISMLSMLR